MEPADSIGRLGFSRWYERRLIEGHAWFVSAFICVIAIAACAEELAFRGVGPAGEGSAGPVRQRPGSQPLSITDTWAYYDTIVATSTTSTVERRRLTTTTIRRRLTRSATAPPRTPNRNTGSHWLSSSRTSS